MMQKIFGVSVFVWGILVLILSLFVLPFCPVMGEMAMPCHSAQIADAVLGAGIAVLGILSFVISQKIVRFVLALVAAIGSLFVALIPTAILGTCPHEHMACHSVAAPVLLLVGILFFIVFLGVAVFWGRRLKNGSHHA